VTAKKPVKFSYGPVGFRFACLSGLGFLLWECADGEWQFLSSYAKKCLPVAIYEHLGEGRVKECE
jgi:hypothetical protein